MTEHALLDFLQISHYAGKHPDFVQGGGGNCSVKFSSCMIIKASGSFLSEVNTESGYVYLDLRTREVLKNQKYKPSLEVQIHFLLGNYVIHTHPILVGGLVCAKEGFANFKKIFKEENLYWINYKNPGRDLFDEVKKFVERENLFSKRPFVLFLKNHGIFISAGSKEECIGIHDLIISKLSDFFDYKNLAYPLEKASLIGYLTPDHVVYGTLLEGRLSGKQKLAEAELLEFSSKVLALINSKKWHAEYLDNNDVNIIKNMEEEKYRQDFLKSK